MVLLLTKLTYTLSLNKSKEVNLNNGVQQQRKKCVFLVLVAAQNIVKLPDQKGIKTFFHTAAMLLFYIIQGITAPKFCIFRKSITTHHCMVRLQVALVSIPPHKLVRLPCCYYPLYEIEEYDFRAIPNGITSVQHFIQICPAVLEFNHADRQTRPVLHTFISYTHTAQRTHDNCNHKLLI
jgi:hypothetical protein